MSLLITIDPKDKRYGGNIQENCEKNLKKEKEYKNDQEKWNDAVKTIIGCGKVILASKRKLNNNYGRTHDDDIEKLSKEQKKVRLIISSSNCEYQIQALKHQRNALLKEIRKRVNVNRQ